MELEDWRIEWVACKSKGTMCSGKGNLPEECKRDVTHEDMDSDLTTDGEKSPYEAGESP